MLPTMRDHGCPPEHHTTNIKTDGTHIERCMLCGYSLTHEQRGGGSSARPSAPSPLPVRSTHQRELS